MPMTAPLAYKGLDSMPTWFVLAVAVLVAIGIVLAYRRRR
ncbi:LPXTG cell wall anchor domain-containing protein [Streptomyces sp. NPDC012825]